jgi:hypothetical protein
MRRWVTAAEVFQHGNELNKQEEEASIRSQHHGAR